MRTVTQLEIILIMWPDEMKDLYESLCKLEGADETVYSFRRELQRALVGRRMLNDV